MATDLHHPPELIPGIELQSNLFRASPLRVSDWLEDFSVSKNPGRSVFETLSDWILGSVIIIFWFTPSLLYRWSLKSTAVLYAPLLWILQPLTPPDHTLEQRLQLFVRSDMVRFAMMLSIFTIGFFIVKVWMMVTWAEFVNVFANSKFDVLFSLYVQPTIIPIWQMAMVANSCFIIALMLFVRSCIRHIEVGAPRSETVTERVITWTTITRRLFTIYTMACTFYITMRAALQVDWPELGTKPFPWMP